MAKSLADMTTAISGHERRATTKDLAAIGDAIEWAIRDHSGKRWWFNEAQGATFNTADGTEYYALPSPLRVIDDVSVTVSQDPYTLTPRTNGWMEEAYTPAAQFSGKPSDWCVFENQIRMFPIPDGVYAVKVQGYGYALPEYSTDASDTWTTDDETPWANEAYNLIYAHARSIYALNWRKDEASHAAFARSALISLRQLQAENNKRSATGRLRGWGIG